MYLDNNGSKIRNVSRCRPAVQNEIILATKQDFFFTRVVPVQSITDYRAIRFLINSIQDYGRGAKTSSPYQFFPCNFYKQRNWPSKLSDFYF